MVIYRLFAAEETEASGIAALGIDWQAFIVQLITFLLVFGVLYKFVFHRVVQLLEKRRKTIEEGVRLSGEMRAEKEQLDEDVARIQQKTRAKADELIAESKDKASLIIKQAEEKASVKADQIIEEAKQKITDETQKAKRQLEREMVELIVASTEAVIRERLDADKDRELVNRVLKERI